MFEAQCIEEGKRRIWIRQYQYIIDSPCSPPPPPHTHTELVLRRVTYRGRGRGEGEGGAALLIKLCHLKYIPACVGEGGDNSTSSGYIHI